MTKIQLWFLYYIKEKSNHWNIKIENETFFIFDLQN